MLKFVITGKLKITTNMPGYSPKPDADTIEKKAYLCATRGCGVDCGYVKRIYCNDCVTKENRKVVEEEYKIIHKLT